MSKTSCLVPRFLSRMRISTALGGNVLGHEGPRLLTLLEGHHVVIQCCFKVALRLGDLSGNFLISLFHRAISGIEKKKLPFARVFSNDPPRTSHLSTLPVSTRPSPGRSGSEEGLDPNTSLSREPINPNIRHRSSQRTIYHLRRSKNRHPSVDPPSLRLRDKRDNDKRAQQGGPTKELDDDLEMGIGLTMTMMIDEPFAILPC